MSVERRHGDAQGAVIHKKQCGPMEALCGGRYGMEFEAQEQSEPSQRRERVENQPENTRNQQQGPAERISRRLWSLE